jgi:hypothetical protein
MSNINPQIVQLFESHGISACLQGPGIIFPGHPFRAAALVVREIQHQAAMSIQLDVRFEIAPRQIIVESFAGIGSTRDEAILDAVKNFTTSSLHVLLAAFFRQPSEQITQEEWLVHGSRQLATIGPIIGRGPIPQGGDAAPGWFQHLVTSIQAERLNRGTHWIRLFYGQKASQVLSSEVLLDNQPWHPVQTKMAAFPWPDVDEFYSLRIFLVLQNL